MRANRSLFLLLGFGLLTGVSTCKKTEDPVDEPADSDPQVDDTGEKTDDTGERPDPETIQRSGTVWVQTAEGLSWAVTGARVWGEGLEDSEVQTGLHGEYTLTTAEEGEICAALPGSEEAQVCVSSQATAEELMLTIEADEDTVVHRLVDADGRVPVYRGLVNQDLEWSVLDAEGGTLAEGRTGTNGVVVAQAPGATSLSALVVGLNTTKAEQAEPLEALLEGEDGSTLGNSNPRLTGPPVIFNGTAWFRTGEELEVSASAEDPDGDTVTVDWVSLDGVAFTGSKGSFSPPGNDLDDLAIVLTDGRGGAAVYPLALYASTDTIINGSIEAVGEVGYESLSVASGDQTTTLDENGGFELLLTDPGERVVVTFSGPDVVPFTEVLYPSGGVVHLEPNLTLVETTTFHAGEDTQLTLGDDKELVLSIPGGSFLDSSGARTKDEIELAWAVMPSGSELSGEPWLEGEKEDGFLHALSGVYLSFRSPKDPTQIYTLDSEKVRAHLLLDEDDAKGLEKTIVAEECPRYGNYCEYIVGEPPEASYAPIDLDPGFESGSLVVAEPADLEHGCVRLYVPDRMVKGSTAAIAVDNGQMVTFQPLSGPITTLGPLAPRTNVTLYLYDGLMNIIDTQTVNTGSNLLTVWPQEAPASACTDLVMPANPPIGTFLTRKLVDPDDVPSGYTPADVGEAYYDAIDPNGDRDTFQKWMQSLDWDKVDSGGAFDPRSDVGGDTMAIYGNSADLDFGREMHLKIWEDWDPAQTGEEPIVAMYTTNYASVHDAAAENAVIATVAMEFSPHPTTGGAYYTKFFVFDPQGNRIAEAPLDDFGSKALPDLCTNCHGGAPASETAVFATGSPVYPDEGRMNDGFGAYPRFIPFAVETFSYANAALYPTLSQSQQEAEFEELNESLLLTDVDPDARVMLHSWYGSSSFSSDDFGASSTGVQDIHWMPDGTQTGDWTGEPELYEDVVQPYCRSCHLSFPIDLVSDSSFTNWGGYMDTLLCQLPTQIPHAQVTQRNFYQDVQAKVTLIDAMTGTPGWTATECPN